MADGTLPKRLRYYYGQFLQEADFTAEQQYHIEQRQRLARIVRTPGVVEGLEVRVVNANVAQAEVFVDPGTAVDRDGELLIVTTPLPVTIPRDADGAYMIVIAYATQNVDPATVGGNEFTRVQEQPVVAAVAERSLKGDDPRIQLARLTISGGTITRDTADRTKPPRAGTTLGGDLSVGGATRLLGATTIGTEQVASSLTVSGPLSVTGNATLGTLSVSGNVGIGTTEASEKLEINVTGGDGQHTNFLSLSNPGGGATQESRIVWKNGPNKQYAAAIASQPGGGYNSGDLRFQTAANGALADRMMIDSSGNVGIGAPATDARLSVTTNTANRANNTAMFTAPQIGPHASHIHYGTTGDWYIRSAASNGNVILQDSGGPVSVGGRLVFSKRPIFTQTYRFGDNPDQDTGISANDYVAAIIGFSGARSQGIDIGVGMAVFMYTRNNTWWIRADIFGLTERWDRIDVMFIDAAWVERR